MLTPPKVYGFLFGLWLLEAAAFAPESRAYLIPHLSLVYLVYTALVLGPGMGLKAGCFLGLLLDLSGAGPFGLHWVLYGTTGLACGYLVDKVFLQSLATRLLVPLGAYLMILFFSYLTTRSGGHPFQVTVFLSALTATPMVVTVVTAPFLFKLFSLRGQRKITQRYPIRRFPS